MAGGVPGAVCLRSVYRFPVGQLWQAGDSHASRLLRLVSCKLACSSFMQPWLHSLAVLCGVSSRPISRVRGFSELEGSEMRYAT